MQVLVLNKFWVPIKTTSVFNAIEKVFKGKARIISEELILHDWNEWIKYSVNNPSENRVNGIDFYVNKPVVIIQTTGGGTKTKRIIPNRKNIFSRDSFTCQYCGEIFRREKLTIDHVLPKSRGGKITWTNSVTCCKRCNNKKDNKTPEEANMHLLNKPCEPSIVSIFINSGNISNKWKEILQNFKGK